MNIKHAFLSLSLALAACGGSGSPMTSTQTIQRVPARSNVVAFMGDSITAHWATVEPMPVPPGFTVMNLGIAGQNTQEMLDRFQAQVIDASPQVGVVVIEAGTNDIDEWVPGQEYTDASTTAQAFGIENIEAMAAMAKSAGIRVIIGSVPLRTDFYPASYGITTTQQIYDWNQQLIKLCADNGYTYADYLDVLTLPDGNQDLSLYIDGVHPNALGYDRMWPVVQSLIEEELQ